MSQQQIKAGGASYSLGLTNDGFINGLKKAELALSNWGEAIKNHGRNVASAGALLMAPYIGAIASAVSFSREMTRISLQTGMGVESLAELSFMAEMTGGSLQALANVFLKFEDNVNKLWLGTEEAIQAFGRLRLNWRMTRDANPAALFDEVIDRIAALRDPTDRVNIGFRIFGEQFREILPLVARGTAGLRAMRDQMREERLGVSASEVAMLKKFGDEITLLWASLRRFGMEIAVTVAPAFEFVIKLIRQGLLAVRDWVSNNAGLVQGIAVLAGFLVTYGAGMLTFGLALKVAGLQVAMLHGLLLPIRSVLGVVFGLLRSGTVALAAISYNLRYFGNVVSSVSIGLTKGFLGPMWKIAGAAIWAMWGAVTALGATMSLLLAPVFGLATALIGLGGIGVTAFASISAAVWTLTLSVGALLFKIALISGALIFAFVHVPPVIMSAWNRVTPFFSSLLTKLADTAKTTFGGIVDSMKVGNMEGAMKIGVLGVKLMWMDFKEWMSNMWDELAPSLEKAFLKAISVIQDAWANFFGIIAYAMEKLGLIPEGTTADIANKLNDLKKTPEQKKEDEKKAKDKADADKAGDIAEGIVQSLGMDKETNPFVNMSDWMQQVTDPSSPFWNAATAEIINNSPDPENDPRLRQAFNVANRPQQTSQIIQMAIAGVNTNDDQVFEQLQKLFGREFAEMVMLERQLLAESRKKADEGKAAEDEFNAFMDWADRLDVSASRDAAARELNQARDQAAQDLEDWNFVSHTGRTPGVADPAQMLKSQVTGTFNGDIAPFLAADSIDKQQLKELERVNEQLSRDAAQNAQGWQNVANWMQANFGFGG